MRNVTDGINGKTYVPLNKNEFGNIYRIDDQGNLKKVGNIDDSKYTVIVIIDAPKVYKYLNDDIIPHYMKEPCTNLASIRQGHLYKVKLGQDTYARY